MWAKLPAMSGLTGLLAAGRERSMPIWLFAVFVLFCGCRSTSVLVELDQARSLSADLRVELNKANDASNRAVMADSEEASVAFAREAEAATRAANQDTAKLAPLLQHLALPEELRAFEEFRTHWDEYQALERRILALAVENTNLKARALAFGPGRQAADAFRDALDTVVASASAENRCRASELAAQAVLGVREIQALQAPHIAEREDATMTALEQKMANLETSARHASSALAPLVAPSAAPALESARAALQRFAEVSAQIIALSRKNTNVLSLELALRDKPTLVANCDNSLKALHQALAEEHLGATR